MLKMNIASASQFNFFFCGFHPIVESPFFSFCHVRVTEHAEYVAAQHFLE